MKNWKYGMVLRRGRLKVMFVMFDPERTKMLGGGNVQMVAMRLNNGDRMPPSIYKIGAMGNYSAAGWVLEDD